MDKEHSSLLVQCFTKIVGNTGAVWFLHYYFPSLFIIENTFIAVIIIGLVFGLINFIVRPVLILITLPLKALASVLTIILVNGGIIACALWFLPQVTTYSLSIGQGFVGWSVVMTVIGLTNWVLTELT